MTSNSWLLSVPPGASATNKQPLRGVNIHTLWAIGTFDLTDELESMSLLMLTQLHLPV